MRFIAMASVLCASVEIEPSDIAPVAKRLTISLAGSTSSIGTGVQASVRSFAWMMLFTAVWSIAYALELASGTLEAMLFWIRIEYVGISFIPSAWFAFVVRFVGRDEWLTWRNRFLVFGFPTLTLLAVWTNSWHHLHYRSVSVDSTGPFPLLAIERGPWYLAHTVFFYLLLGVGMYILIQRFHRADAVYRRQNLAVLIGAIIAMVVAIPIGMMTAVYLTQYAAPRVRRWVKPLLEILAGVPTVVYGYFAALTVAPAIRSFAVSIGLPYASSESALAAGLVMGVMIIPYVASLSEDAMRAVPMSLREGAYAMGSTRYQTAVKVVVPAALSGIAAAYILGISRAVGETMILAVAAGMQPNFTLNPMESASTVTSFIVQVALGDLPHGSIGYQTIFAAGLSLMLLTLVFNLAGFYLRNKYREAY